MERDGSEKEREDGEEREGKRQRADRERRIERERKDEGGEGRKRERDTERE